jgi:hypothetical protein
VSAGRKKSFGGVALKLAICTLLLGWIFHAIFINEGKLALQKRGGNWDALPRLEQWRVAWTQGPMELAASLSQVNGSAMALSLVFMGLTIVLGMTRWRILLRAQGLDLSVMRTAEISLIAHFFNSFLLGSTGGDLLKAYYAARETHHLKAEAVTTGS